MQFQATSGREVDEVDEVNKIKKIKKSMPTWLLAYHKIIDCQINTNLIADFTGVIKKIFIRFNMRHYEIKGFSRIFSRVSRFLAVFVSFSYFSSYFATTENQVLHAYKDWTGLISKDVLSKDVLSSADIISSEDINESVSLDVNVNVSLDISEDMTDIADMAVSNDIPASSDIYDDNEFDNFVSHDTNDTGNTADTEGDTEADTEGEAEDSDEDSADMANSGNTVDPVAPVASGPDEENTPNNTNTPNNENNENNDNNPNNPDDSDSIAILTTRLTSDHHLIATLSISGVMGADVAVFPNTINATGPNATGPDEVTAFDEVTSTGGNIYTVSNVPNTLDTGGSYAGSDGSSPISEDKPDSLLLNFENEEGVVESVRLWLDNEIDETVILDGISIPSDDTINTNSNGNDNGSSSSNDSNFSSRAADGSNSNRSSQPDQPRLAVPLSDLSDLSSSSSSDLAAISDASNTSGDVDNVNNADNVNTSYALDWFIGLDQLKSPIIVILPDTEEYYYFENGKALADDKNFDQEYKISEVRATTRAEIEIRLEKRK